MLDVDVPSKPWLVGDTDAQDGCLPEWIIQDRVYDDLDEIPRIAE